MVVKEYLHIIWHVQVLCSAQVKIDGDRKGMKSDQKYMVALKGVC